MMRRRSVLALLLLRVLSSCVCSNESKDCFSDGVCSSTQSADCTLFLAPSTVAGLGVFTAVDRREGDEIGDGDVLLPLKDIYFYHDNDLFHPFRDYLWDARDFGMHEEALQVDTFAPGLYSLMNSHSTLYNVARGEYEYEEDTQSPAFGSMTPYYNGKTVATTDIPAGSELLRTYGKAWFESRDDVLLNNDTVKTRSLKELKETGRCLDNIRHDESTLTDAGRGAFATRDLKEGTIITGSPLIHVPYEALGYIYHVVYDEESEEQVPDHDDVVALFLLWNYCMGHDKSYMLVCPYGAGVNYMNHNQTRANVRLQWAPHGILNHNDAWLTKSPSEFEHEYTSHLTMDYVATRDIQEGEELFLDYGDEFEQAWLEHVQEWEPDEEYMSAAEWNDDNGDSYLHTEKEQQWFPYPNLVLKCHPTVYTEDYQEGERLRDADELWPTWQKGYPCRIYARVETQDEDFVYTVHIYNEENDEVVTRYNVERHLMTMMDDQYTTAWHRDAAFRHFVGIPDAIFPTAWFHNETDTKEESQDEETDEEQVEED